MHNVKYLIWFGNVSLVIQCNMSLKKENPLEMSSDAWYQYIDDKRASSEHIYLQQCYVQNNESTQYIIQS